jgi:hypothetical protein
MFILQEEKAFVREKSSTYERVNLLGRETESSGATYMTNRSGEMWKPSQCATPTSMDSKIPRVSLQERSAGAM